MDLLIKYNSTYNIPIIDENYQKYYTDLIEDIESADLLHNKLINAEDHQEILDKSEILKAYTKRYRSLYKFIERKNRKELEPDLNIELENLKNLAMQFYDYNLGIFNSLSKIETLPIFFQTIRIHAIIHSTDCLGVAIFHSLKTSDIEETESRYLTYRNLIDTIIDLTIDRSWTREIMDVLISSIVQQYEILSSDYINKTPFELSVFEYQKATIANIETVGKLFSLEKIIATEDLISKAKEQLENFSKSNEA